MRKYISSLRLGRKHLITMVYDILQILVLSIIAVGIVLAAYSFYAPLMGVQMEAKEIEDYVIENKMLPELTPELDNTMQAGIGQIKSFFVKIILLSIIFCMCYLVVSSLGRSMVYSRLKGIRFRAKYFRRFLLFNSLWIILWMAIIALSVYIFKFGILLYILLFEALVFVHLSFVLRYSIDEKSSFRKLFRLVVSKGIKKIHRFALPSVLIILTFIILIQITRLDRLLPMAVMFPLVFILVFAYLTWARSYYSLTIDGVK